MKLSVEDNEPFDPYYNLIVERMPEISRFRKFAALPIRYASKQLVR